MNIVLNENISHEMSGLDAHILEIAYSELDSSWQRDDAFAAFTRVYYVEEGEGKIKSENSEIFLTKGNIYIIPPGISYSYSCERELKKLYCHLNILRADRTNAVLDLKDFVVLPNNSDRVKKVINLWQNGSPLDALELKSIIVGDCVKALRSKNVALGELRSYSKTVTDAMKIIEASPKISITTESLSKQLLISESKLKKSFRSEVGIPIGKYVTDRVIFAAEQMLHGKSSIEEISSSLGFCDRFYFSKVFSKRLGISPAKYRNKMFP